MYFVRTVWELIRLKRDTGPPARMQEPIFLVFAVFFDGFDMIVTGAESNVAHVRAGCCESLNEMGGGCDMDKDRLKLFALAVPVTCKNLKLAIMLLSIGAFCSGDLSPFSDTMLIESC